MRKVLILTSAIIAGMILAGCGKKEIADDRPALAETANQDSVNAVDSTGALDDTLAAINAGIDAGDSAGVQDNILVDTRNGQEYRTVKIGNLTWMAENLNYRTSNSWCYDNVDSNCAKYGRLYTWNAAMKACPAGWRLSTREDWNDLGQAAGGQRRMEPGGYYWAVAVKLKSKTGWEDWEGKSGSGTDDYGFSATPGGSLNADEGVFYHIGENGCWWSATGDFDGYAYSPNMGSYSTTMSEGDGTLKNHGCSARCVRNEGSIPPAGGNRRTPPPPGSQFNPKIKYDSFTDARDGRTYRAVTIGNLTWMAENLNYNDAKSSRCLGDDIDCEFYGRSYDWNAAMSACPAGWRLPTNKEWGDLVQAAGGEGIAGKKLKSKTGWDNNSTGTDDFGFSALFGGSRGDAGSVGGMGQSGGWWSATEKESGGTTALFRNMYRGSDGVAENAEGKYCGFSVRCVRQ